MNLTILKNIGSNWAGMGVNILVAFFMMPFVLQKLGPIGYGFWAFLQSVMSFMFILDFGIRSSLTRYLAKYYAQGDHIEANRVFNVGLMSYSIVCGFIIVCSVPFGWFLPKFFHVHSDHQTIFLTVVMVGLGVGLNFPAAVFNGILTGHQRYDLMNLAQIISLFIRTVLILVWLTLGHGLVAIALATLIGSVSLFLFNVVFSIRVYPSLRISLLQWDWKTIKLLANHGVYSFLAIGAMRLLTDTGNVLVGLFIGPAAVTLYSIGVSLTTYANQLVGGITTTLTPAASALEVKANWQELRELCFASSKLIGLTGFSILITYVVSGDIFIELWLGEQFKNSYPILVVLSLCWGFHYIQNSVFVILIGLSRHKIPAFLMFGQALLSIILGLVFVQSNGMLGVALGTLISSGVFNIFSLSYGLNQLKISLMMYLREAIFPAMLGLIPFGVSLVGMMHLHRPDRLLEYFGIVATAVIVMVIFLPLLSFNVREINSLWKHFYLLAHQVGGLVPSPMRSKIREVIQEYAFRRRVLQIKKSQIGSVPAQDALIELREGWGNEGFSASVGFLEDVAYRASITEGPILECGSGLTTIILGLIGGRRGCQIWTLEHDKQWYAYMVKKLQEYNIKGVHVCYAPLKDYGEYTWYNPNWEEMPSNFQLVICDGPPGNTPGGRYGFLPLSAQRLAPSVTILLDDVHRKSEAKVAYQWAHETGMSLKVQEVEERTFAVLTRTS